MSEQLTFDGEPTLKAHNLDTNELDEVDREGAHLVSDDVLDMPWRDEDQAVAVAGTLRQWLAEAKEPCWLSGTE